MSVAFAIIAPSIMLPLCMRCPLMQDLCAGVRWVVLCVPGRIRLEFELERQQQQHIRNDDCKRRECVHQQREQLQLQRHNFGFRRLFRSVCTSSAARP